ncbi:MAG: alkaline phosphatase PhoX, partial [Dongiaceae bacterium]
MAEQRNKAAAGGNDRAKGRAGRSDSPHLEQLIATRLSRREALRGAAGAATATALYGVLGMTLQPGAARAVAGSSLTFTELKRVYDETHHVAPGYAANVLVRWGDPIAADAPAFDVAAQSAAAQEKQFGYNCDFIAYLPLPAGLQNSGNGLLCVNNEYPSPQVMFPGMTEDDAGKAMTRE